MPIDLSPVQLIIILVVAALVLGSRRLPAFGRDLGRGIREFGGAIRGSASDDEVSQR